LVGGGLSLVLLPLLARADDPSRWSNRENSHAPDHGCGQVIRHWSQSFPRFVKR